MDEMKFDALCNAVSSMQTILWMLIDVCERNGMSKQEADTINVALSNYNYFMSITIK